MKTTEKEIVEITLNNGALLGLSEGAKMDAIASIVEYVDNAADQDATKIQIDIDNTQNTLCVLSVEKTDLKKENWKKLYSLGSSAEIKTRKYGVGKYNQGFKYAGAYLIGRENKGQVIVAVKPVDGEQWGAIHNIDYTDKNNYQDKSVELTNGECLPDGYDFMVKVIGCQNIEDREINLLKVNLGIRYRQYIQEGKLTIIVNNDEIDAQDRLYSKWGDRVDYHGPIYFEWKGDKKAMSFEWCDLRKGSIGEYEWIKYDDTLGIKGRASGCAITSRACGEVAINGVTIIYDKEMKNLTGISPQPSSSGFRFRLNIHNLELADKYIKGGNKSFCSVDKSFSENDDTKEVRTHISDVYYSVINRYKVSERKHRKSYYEIDKLSDFCEKNDITCNFKITKDDRDVEAFVYDESYDRIIVNVNNPLLSSFKNDEQYTMFITALIYGKCGATSKEIYKCLNKYKYICQDFELI